jgi:hypothetical protein
MQNGMRKISPKITKLYDIYLKKKKKKKSIHYFSLKN